MSMKKRLGILVIFCTLVIGLTTTTIVSADLNLEWGFEVGDQFHFRRSGTPFFPILDYYVEIDSIPVNITGEMYYNDTIDSYLGYYTCFNEDGTEMDQPEYFAALPIGNWSGYRDEWNDTSSTLNTTEWIDTETEWGFVGSTDLGYGLTTTTLKFSKIDGVVTLLRMVLEPEEGITTTLQYGRRDPQADQTLITVIVIGIGIGIAALVIVGAAIKFR